MSRESRRARRAGRVVDLLADYRNLRRWLTAATVALCLETAALLALLSDRIG